MSPDWVCIGHSYVEKENISRLRNWYSLYHKLISSLKNIWFRIWKSSGSNSFQESVFPPKLIFPKLKKWVEELIASI